MRSVWRVFSGWKGRCRSGCAPAPRRGRRRKRSSTATVASASIRWRHSIASASRMISSTTGRTPFVESFDSAPATARRSPFVRRATERRTMNATLRARRGHVAVTRPLACQKRQSPLLCRVALNTLALATEAGVWPVTIGWDDTREHRDVSCRLLDPRGDAEANPLEDPLSLPRGTRRGQDPSPPLRG
jgi:hypothetical protein